MKPITIQYDEAKLVPIRKYMEKKNLSLEAELEKVIDTYYSKYVPAQVREYLDMCADKNLTASAMSKSKSKQQATRTEGAEK